MMLLHCHGRNLLKKLHFPKQVVYVELFHAFHPAFVVLSHFLPLQIDSELYENVEDAVPQVSNKVEALGSIWAFVILLEDPVSELYFVAVFAVESHENEKNKHCPVKSSNVRERRIDLLESSLRLKLKVVFDNI